MTDFADFIGDSNLLAHNASFDSRFLGAELARLGRSVLGEFTCSLLISRRIYQDAPNHKLGTLINYKNIVARYGLEDIPFSLIKRLSKTPKAQIDKLLTNYINKIT